ncbi:hypothetical protein ACS386_02935 [Flavobacteriaceae bacterium LMO-SS05]
MPFKINLAQKRASLKKKGYHASFKIEMKSSGNKTNMGTATRT